MLTLTWEVYGDTLVREEFSRFTEGVKDFRPVFEQIEANLEHAIIPYTFATFGGRIGAAWQPLSPKYAAWKAQHYPGTYPLVRTRRLERSLIAKTGDSIRSKTAKEFRFGTKVPYGIYHQQGTSRMPARKFLGLTHDDEVAWGKMVHKYCVGLMGRLRYSPLGGA